MVTFLVEGHLTTAGPPALPHLSTRSPVISSRSRQSRDEIAKSRNKTIAHFGLRQLALLKTPTSEPTTAPTSPLQTRRAATGSGGACIWRGSGTRKDRREGSGRALIPQL